VSNPGDTLPDVADLNRFVAEGRLVQAAALGEALVARRPSDPAAQDGLGVALFGLGRLDAAEAAFRAAIDLAPAVAGPRRNLAMVLASQERWAEAEAAFARALALDSRRADLWAPAGRVLAMLARKDEAIAAYRAALALGPSTADVLFDLGNLLAERHEYDEAEALYRQALHLSPDYAAVWNNLACLTKETALRTEPPDLARLREADAQFARAAELSPNEPEVTFNRAMSLLALGDLPAGFAAYERRWDRADFPARFEERPRWRGEPIEGRTILLHWEQGFGDTMLAVRFADLLKRRGARVMALVQDPLRALLSRTPGVDRWLASDDLIPPFDYHAPMMSLGGLLGVTLDELPGRYPYIIADPARIGRWADRLSTYQGLKVGVVWRGNPGQARDGDRSLPLEALAPLTGIPDVALFSLQKGVDESPSGPVGSALIDLAPELTDFAETAAALANLDLLISCCTSVANLAGAMGRPTWCLVSHAPDWRWMPGRTDSPWYPSITVYRQHRPADWNEVVDRVAVDLTDLSRRPASASSPPWSA
jgi:Flp pilus assembly protein TadD